MSRIDRRVNLDKKGKGRAHDTTDEADRDEADQVDATPADGISDLAPAPTPEGLVPSEMLPSNPDPPRVAYDLPPGVGSIQECAIFYIGGESLGLNNLLMTHGRCSVRLPAD